MTVDERAAELWEKFITKRPNVYAASDLMAFAMREFGEELAKMAESKICDVRDVEVCGDPECKLALMIAAAIRERIR